MNEWVVVCRDVALREAVAVRNKVADVVEVLDGGMVPDAVAVPDGTTVAEHVSEGDACRVPEYVGEEVTDRLPVEIVPVPVSVAVADCGTDFVIVSDCVAGTDLVNENDGVLVVVSVAADVLVHVQDALPMMDNDMERVVLDDDVAQQDCVAVAVGVLVVDGGAESDCEAVDESVSETGDVADRDDEGVGVPEGEDVMLHRSVAVGEDVVVIDGVVVPESSSVEDNVAVPDATQV